MGQHAAGRARDRHERGRVSLEIMNARTRFERDREHEREREHWIRHGQYLVLQIPLSAIAGQSCLWQLVRPDLPPTWTSRQVRFGKLRKLKDLRMI